MISLKLPVEEPSNCILKLDITRLSARCRKIEKKIVMAGVEWTFSAALPEKRDEPEMTFTFSIGENYDSTLWGYTADVHFHITNQKFSNRSFNKHVNQKFCFQNQYITFSLNRTLRDLFNPANGFTTFRPATQIFMELTVNVTAVEGTYRPIHENFLEPRGQIRSEILNAHGTKLYVSKQMMAAHSKIFEACLYPEDETEEEAAVPKEIPVPLDMSLLLSFLHLIHSPEMDIDFEFKAFHDLMLCCRLFKCEHLVLRLSNELIHTNKMKLYRKFQLAEKFQLIKLQNACIEAFKKAGDKTWRYHLQKLINEKNPALGVSESTIRRLRTIKNIVSTIF